jgi:hypothetical protein
VTCVLSALPRQAHLELVSPSLLGPRWSARLLVRHAPWSRWAGAGSLGVHGLLLGLAGWGVQGRYQRPTPIAVEHLSRAAEVRYLLIAPQPTHLSPKPQRRPVRPDQTASLPEPSEQQPTPSKSVSLERPAPEPFLGIPSVTGPATPGAVEVQELSPGVITGTGSSSPASGPLAGSGSEPGRTPAISVKLSREVARRSRSKPPRAGSGGGAGQRRRLSVSRAGASGGAVTARCCRLGCVRGGYQREGGSADASCDRVTQPASDRQSVPLPHLHRGRHGARRSRAGRSDHLRFTGHGRRGQPRLTPRIPTSPPGRPGHPVHGPGIVPVLVVPTKVLTRLASIR